MAAQPQFQLHKLYIKDASFQIPEGSVIFQNEWAPELNVEVNTQATKLNEQNTFEVALKIKATVKSSNKLAFEAEVQQAGIFEITDLPKEQLENALGAYCPNLLYPYLREAISDLVTRGGFPQLSLAPINFEMLYQQQRQNGGEFFVNGAEPTAERSAKTAPATEEKKLKKTAATAKTKKKK